MGNSVNSKVNNDEIIKETNAYPVVMYSKPHCGYCKMAKTLLNEQNILFKEHDLDLKSALSPDTYQAYVNGLIYSTRQTSVPQIFICGKFIGGYAELNKMHQAKKLFDAIAECSHQYDPIGL